MKYLKNKKGLWFVLFIILIIVDFVGIYQTFSLMIEIDSEKSREIKVSNFKEIAVGVMAIFFAPMPIAIGQVDQYIRLNDIWYYISAICNVFLWSYLILWLVGKNEKLSKKLYKTNL